MNKTNIALGLALVAVVLATFALFPNAQTIFGALSASDVQATNFTEITTANGIVIGSAGTGIAQLLKGGCSLIASSFTVAASTTVPMDCAIANVIGTDGVFAQFGTSTANLLGGWSVAGASASSTAGFITIDVTNGTGATAVIPASLASTTKYIILR